MNPKYVMPQSITKRSVCSRLFCEIKKPKVQKIKYFVSVNWGLVKFFKKYFFI